jgi:hypothetical protein
VGAVKVPMARNVVVILILSVAFLTAFHRFNRKSAPEAKSAEDVPQTFQGNDFHPIARGPGHFPAPPSEEAFGARIAHLLQDDAARESLKLSADELADYLARNQTNAASLLVAFEASHDRGYLKRAAEAFPNDPFVQSKVLFHNVFPEERGEWIARLKQTAPENSLPHLLAAQELMKQGDATGALAEIVGGRGKKLDDYTRETMAGMEEAYLLAGRSVAEAKALGGSEVLLPQLAPFKKLAMDLRDAADTYAQAGDDTSQAAILEGGWIIGSQLRESGHRGALLNELVGLAIENLTLHRWPETANASFLDRPVADQLNDNAELRQQVRTGTATWNEWLPRASESEVIAFYDRLHTFGERNAMEWVMRLHPEFVPEGTLVSEN